MARFAIDLPVFIASPSDVSEERDVAERVVLELSLELSGTGIALRPVRWESAVPFAVGVPEDSIMPLLDQSELVIAIFHNRVGSMARTDSMMTAAEEELDAAMSKAAKGELDSVCVMEHCDSSDGVKALLGRYKTAHRLLAITYRDLDQFRDVLSSALRRWSMPWRDISQICQWTTSTVLAPQLPSHVLDEGRFEQFRSSLTGVEPALSTRLGQVAVMMYQELGTAGGGLPVKQLAKDEAVRPLIREGFLEKRGSELYFASLEHYYLFCALGLLDAIENERHQAVERKAYVNQVHQYVAGALNHYRERREGVIAQLRRWLRGSTLSAKSRPVMRDFAAYELGMLMANEASQELIEALSDSGDMVRRYAMASLGKLRCRAALPRLIQEFNRALDPRLKLLVGQVVCRIVGVAEYPL